MTSKVKRLDVSVKKCDNKVFRKFTSRLKALSEMTLRLHLVMCMTITRRVER